MRDNFSRKVQRILEKRAGHKCSVCDKSTSGPGTGPGDVLSDGVAAHTTAASTGGPRFDSTLSSEERRSPENGIWVCTQHGREIDVDGTGFSVKTLRGLKRSHEEKTAKEFSRATLVGDQSACVIELPYTTNAYKLFEIIQTQPYTYATTSVLREQLRRTQSRSNLLDLASEVLVGTWDEYPEVAGILATWLGNNSDLWQPLPTLMDKMEQLCIDEISADDWTLVASINPLAFALLGKKRPKIYQKTLERTICNRHWREADAAHALRYYGNQGTEMSAIIRHLEEGLRPNLLGTYDAPRIIDLLLAHNTDLNRPSTRNRVLHDLLMRQAAVLATNNEVKLARYVTELVDGTRKAPKE